MDRLFLSSGALMGMLGVVAGTFGAHALDPSLPSKSHHAFETGVQYQMYHALALLAVAWLCHRGGGRLATWAGVCFLVGIVCFSGSLYLLVITGVHGWGWVAPIGGVAFLLGWGLLFTSGLKLQRRGLGPVRS